MLVVGAAGFIALAIGGAALIWVGTVAAFAGRWGWTGLLIFATVHLNQEAPARATGIVQAGAATGGALGPFAFGAIVVHTSYATRHGAAAAALLSALLIYSFAPGSSRSGGPAAVSTHPPSLLVHERPILH